MGSRGRNARDDPVPVNPHVADVEVQVREYLEEHCEEKADTPNAVVIDPPVVKAGGSQLIQRSSHVTPIDRLDEGDDGLRLRGSPWVDQPRSEGCGRRSVNDGD